MTPAQQEAVRLYKENLILKERIAILEKALADTKEVLRGDLTK